MSRAHHFGLGATASGDGRQQVETVGEQTQSRISLPAVMLLDDLLTPYYGTGCIVASSEGRMTTALKIGQLAKAVGVNIETIRYYERLHLLGPTSRLPSGYRLYDSDSQRRLRFIKNAQALGFTLHEIAELLDLRVTSAARCGDVQRRAQAKLAGVEAKVRDLGTLARALRSLIGACDAGRPTDKCPILQTLEKERRPHDDNRKMPR